jgi:hypothetical protein
MTTNPRRCSTASSTPNNDAFRRRVRLAVVKKSSIIVRAFVS